MKLLRNVAFLFVGTILWTACKNSGSRHHQRERDTSHYTGQDYIDITLDSNFVNHYLQQDTAYADYVRDFYRQRQFHYAWVNNDGHLTEQAGNFINMMKADAAYGINDTTMNSLYDTLLMEGAKLPPTGPLASRAELMLTRQFFAYGNKAWGGLTSDTAKSLEWFIPRKKIDMQSLLDSMVNRPANAFEEPVNKMYKLLRDRLPRFAELEKLPWDSLKTTQKITKKGDSSLLISQVKERLHLLGDLKQADSSNVFTAALDSAIRNFQDRTGLEINGTIQAPLLAQLNITPKQRIRQILINMERLRWVPAETPSTYLLVNIPGFRLYVYDSSKLAWYCDVVVGKPGAHTVIFSKEMQYVVFAPYWNVTPSIISHEIIPHIRRNPGYLASQNMEVVDGSGKPIPTSSINWAKYTNNFPYIIRQKPGGSNSLGKVKFLFPNEYNIYLHDTPSKGLFSENTRTFSHGCIRVSQPQHLAEWLLRNDPSWNTKKITDAMNGTKETFVTLKQKIPVYIGYFTAYIDSNGQLCFRDDVYGHDAQLAAALFGKK
jgi:L,D-transpeptidase YcbB